MAGIASWDAEVKPNLTYLTDHITNLQRILISLIAKNIISVDESEIISKETTNQQKNFKLLVIVKAKDWRRIKTDFIQILRDTNNEHCANIINEVSTSTAATVMPQQQTYSKRNEIIIPHDLDSNASENRLSPGAAIASMFNNYFGSNKTYISNSFSKKCYVILHKTQLYLSDITFTFQTNGMSLSGNISNEQILHTFPVAPSDDYKCERKDITSFMTIIAQVGMETKLLCKNRLIEANKSFIVTRDGSVKKQKYGGDLWEDEEGINHKTLK